ncbi:hypothetical protein OA57_04020 [Chelonobacter oris]|uniref:HTH lysR-type domain-containing protein n=1 Tax=Chelonobacter oris TaxID=505317 RepID=A0A0A3AN76_9PAST|nr:LysR family transcriptional regulator [Chelonobacter oris]KGQ70878.1 hypothetical protein OA57_04020 [Chelonobacter oris]
MDYLNDMALFVEVVKAKGFTNAANNLNMPKSTVSGRISKLERSIGLRLLNRTTRRIELTEAGRLYYQKAHKIVDEARLAHQQLTDMLTMPTGTLRITLPVDFAYEVLAAILPHFHRQYPHIHFEFDLSSRRADLISENFDLSIRLGDLKDSGLIAHKLTELDGGLYASSDYLAQQGEPMYIDELSQHRIIRIQAGYNHEWRLWHSHGEQHTVDVDGCFFANSLGFNLRLALQHLGIAALPNIVVRQAVAEGKLIRILPDWHTKPIPVHAITTTRLLPVKVQVFIQFLKTHLQVR